MFRSGVGGGEWHSQNASRTAGHRKLTLQIMLEKVSQHHSGEIDQSEDVDIEQCPVHLRLDFVKQCTLTSTGVVDQNVQLERLLDKPSI